METYIFKNKLDFLNGEVFNIGDEIACVGEKKEIRAGLFW
jgi:hypothetical protein